MYIKKIGLITGAGGAIGSSITKNFLKKLDALILVDINEDTVKSLKNINISTFICDIGNSKSVKDMLKKAEKEVGLPNILVNNAGIGGPFHRIDEVSDEEWYKIIDTNLKGVFNLSKFLLPHMKEIQFGRIINIASVQGYLGASLSSTYVASKHGVIGYTRAIAAEWGEYGITCNAICPGYVNTTMGAQDHIISDHRLKILEKTPLKRIAEPEEVANLASFLINDEAKHITGSVLTIDGGLSCHVGF